VEVALDIPDHSMLADLCPKPSDKNSKSPLSKQSYFEKLDGGIPGLFNALLEDPDDEKWTAFTFPVDYDSSVYGPNSQDTQFYMRKWRKLEGFWSIVDFIPSPDSADSNLQGVSDLKTVTVNCSVTFTSQCLSMTKW
jgi:hypothetical protein